MTGIETRFRMVQKVLKLIATEGNRVGLNAWYKVHSSCNLYGFDCDYLRICETGCVSEELYERKQIPKNVIRAGKEVRNEATEAK